jgi:hypothetical protein
MYGVIELMLLHYRMKYCRDEDMAVMRAEEYC